MKKVFKFYKPNCPPCYTLSRILRHIQIPEDIEIVEINTLKTFQFYLLKQVKN